MEKDPNVVNLKDMFAMITLLGIFSKIGSKTIYDEDELAEECYDMAEAMMEERKRRG